MARVWIAFILSGTACGSIPEGRFRCASASECPADWICEEGLCRSQSQMGMDATTPFDAAFDAPLVDVPSGPLELCNEVDDDSDGRIDEDFDLAWTSEHCGACNQPCAGGYCARGMCAPGVPSVSGWVVGVANVDPADHAAVNDVTVLETGECIAGSFRGGLNLAGQIHSATDDDDAFVYCNNPSVRQQYGGAENDAATSVRRLGDGVLAGGWIGETPQAHLHYWNFTAGAWWADLPGSTNSVITDIGRDDVGRSIVGGSVNGTLGLVAPVGSTNVGFSDSGIDGFALRIPQAGGVSDRTLSIHDHPTAREDQTVYGVSGHGGIVALCGAFRSTISGDVAPAVGTGSAPDAFVALIDADTWMPLFTHPMIGPDEQSCDAVGLDATGNVYVAVHFAGTITVAPGRIETAADAMFDTLVASFDRTGAYRWHDRISRAAGEQRITDLRVMPEGTIYAAGRATAEFLLDGLAAPPGLAPTRGFVVSLDRGGRWRWHQWAGVVAGRLELLGIDVLDRSNGRRMIAAGGNFLGNTAAPSGISFSTPNQAGIVLLFDE